MSLLPLLVLATAGGSSAEPSIQKPPEPTHAVRFLLSSLNYLKEDGDDDGEGDEPYVLVFRCGFKILRSTTPGTFGAMSKPISTGIGILGAEDGKFLGHKENQWAQAGRRYPITTLSYQTQVPIREAHVIGLTALLIDRDGFDGVQRAEIFRAVRSQIEAAIQTIRERPKPFDPTQPLFSGDLLLALNRLSLSPAQMKRIKAMGKGDPDEIGGFQSVVLVSGFADPASSKPNDLMAFIPKVNALGGTRTVRVNVTPQGESFALDFPSRGIDFLDGEFKFTGKCQLLGSVMVPTIQ